MPPVAFVVIPDTGTLHTSSRLWNVLRWMLLFRFLSVPTQASWYGFICRGYNITVSNCVSFISSHCIVSSRLVLFCFVWFVSLCCVESCTCTHVAFPRLDSPYTHFVATAVKSVSTSRKKSPIFLHYPPPTSKSSSQQQPRH